MYPFRMYGELVEIYRYKVVFLNDMLEETAYFPTKEEADYFAAEHESTAEELDISSYSWFEGLTFPTYDEAMVAYDMGEEGYKKYVEKQNAAKPETQITDLQMALAETYESSETQLTNLQLAMAELYEMLFPEV